MLLGLSARGLTANARPAAAPPTALPHRDTEIAPVRPPARLSPRSPLASAGGWTLLGLHTAGAAAAGAAAPATEATSPPASVASTAGAASSRLAANRDCIRELLCQGRSGSKPPLGQCINMTPGQAFAQS